MDGGAAYSHSRQSRLGLLVGLVGGLALQPQVRSRPEIGLLAFNIS